MHRPRSESFPALCLALLMLLFAAVPVQAASAAIRPASQSGSFTTTVTNFDASGNQVVRFDTNGNAVDAHDGMIAEFNGTYYLYGTSYNCGFVWQGPGSPFCGFKVYSSPDLVHWSDDGLLFNPTDSAWQSRCDGNTYGCYRPHVLYDSATGQYVLWVNTYDDSVDYRVFTSTSPTGPFTETSVPTLAVNDNAPATTTNNGDEALFTDDNGTSYIVYTDWRTNGGDLVVEQLNTDDTSGTGNYARVGQSSTEAPAMFKHNGVYYLTYSDPNCGFCAGTGTAYRTATSPLGPWSAATVISSNSCGGQPSFVSPIATTAGTAYLYGSDLWDTQGNEGLANYFWDPLSFGPNGSISPITCQDSFSLDLATGSAGSQNQPPGVDQQDGVSGFRTYCDLRGQIARFQTFVPSSTAVLSSLSYTTFQSGHPNAGLNVEIYQADASDRPAGSVLYTTVIPASSIGWSPRNVTITPDIRLTAGTRYGFLVKSVTTSGCFGMAYSDSAPYPDGSEAYSNDGGSTFSVETNRSLKFSTSMSAQTVPDTSPARLPAGFTWCAAENGTCSLSGTYVVAYGAGSYIYKTVTGNTPCTVANFGGDPAPNVLKSCYLAPSGGPVGYTQCASEYGTCSFSGTALVAFGLDGAFNYQLATSSVACSVGGFGDPLYGVAKSCYVASPGAPDSSWTQCATGETGTCSPPGPELMAYGANGAFEYAVSNGPTACSFTVFGGDPIPRVVKSCYQAGAAPPGYGTRCAVGESGTCTFSGMRTVAYGAGGQYVYKSFTGAAPCDSAAFGSDPAYGVVKSCYLTP